MALNNIFLKVFQDAEEEHRKQIEQRALSAMDSNELSDEADRKTMPISTDQSNAAVDIHYTHSGGPANDGPHFLPLLKQKGDPKKVLKIFAETEVNPSDRHAKSENPADAIDNTAVFQFDEYYQNAQRNTEEAIHFHSERALPEDNESLSANCNTETQRDNRVEMIDFSPIGPSVDLSRQRTQCNTIHQKPEPQTDPNRTYRNYSDTEYGSDEYQLDFPRAYRAEAEYPVRVSVGAQEFENTREISGTFPTIFSRLPQEAIHEFFVLGEFLYDNLLDGHKVFGFRGTRASAGCSTLLLGVADELIRKGLSLLLIDAGGEQSGLLSLLEIKTPQIKYFASRHSICSGHPNRDAESAGRNQIGDSAREIIRTRINDSLMKVSLHKKPEQKFRTLFGRRTVSTSTVSSLYILSTSSIRTELDLRDSEIMSNELRELTGHFDAVLVDWGSCVGRACDTIVNEMTELGEDGYFLIQDCRNPENEFIHTLSEKSREQNVPCLGIIENFV